jgi:hypothetical protein
VLINAIIIIIIIIIIKIISKKMHSEFIPMSCEAIHCWPCPPFIPTNECANNCITSPEVAAAGRLLADGRSRETKNAPLVARGGDARLLVPGVERDEFIWLVAAEWTDGLGSACGVWSAEDTASKDAEFAVVQTSADGGMGRWEQERSCFELVGVEKTRQELPAAVSSGSCTAVSVLGDMHCKGKRGGEGALGLGGNGSLSTTEASGVTFSIDWGDFFLLVFGTLSLITCSSPESLESFEVYVTGGLKKVVNIY